MYRANSRSIFLLTLGRELVDTYTPSTCQSILGWHVGRHLFYLIDLQSLLSVATLSISWSMTRRQVDHYVSVNRRCHIGDVSVDYRPSHISADRVDKSVDKKALWSTAWILKSKAGSRYSKVKKNGFWTNMYKCAINSVESFSFARGRPLRGQKGSLPSPRGRLVASLGQNGSI